MRTISSTSAMIIIIASREQPGLLQVWLACRKMEQEDQGGFLCGLLFHIVFSSYFSILMMDYLKVIIWIYKNGNFFLPL